MEEVDGEAKAAERVREAEEVEAALRGGGRVPEANRSSKAFQTSKKEALKNSKKVWRPRRRGKTTLHAAARQQTHQRDARPTKPPKTTFTRR